MAIESINSVTYKADNLGDVKPRIVIGGNDKDKFIPNINASFFDDEFYFNLNRKDRVVDKEAVTLSENKLKQKIGAEADEYYTDKDGNLKWDIVWDSQPKSLILEWEIEHTDGIEFLYQDELTPEEIADGCVRPDNVINSYAVYCSKKNNKYKTGKICHIYRPFVIDANGKKEWCALDIKNKKLTITLPESFMETAVYPVGLDPIFGFDDDGATEHYQYNSSKPIGTWYNSHTAGADENIIKFSVYCRRIANTTVNMAAYTVSGTVLANRLGSATEITVDSATDQWFHSGAVSIAMVNGSEYGVAMECYGEADGVVMRYDGGAGDNYYTRHDTGENLPSTWVSELNSNRNYSMYATYEAGGGSVYNVSIAESASISDAPSNVASLLAAIAESNNISDSISNIATLLNSIAEITTVSDLISNASTLIAAILEATTVTDLFNALLTFANSISESTAITDQSDAAQILSAAIAENTNISDTLSTIAEFVCAISEDTAVTDLFTSFLGNILEISESVNVTDSMSSIATLLAQVNESAVVTDNFNAIATLLASISEATTITDLISAGNIYLETVNESVTISDLVSVMAAISKYISATMTIKNKLSGTMEIKGKIKGVLQ